MPTAENATITATIARYTLSIQKPPLGQPFLWNGSDHFLKINANQLDALRAFTEIYASNVPDELARRRVEQIDQAGRNPSFAWADGVNPRDPHYYRIQTEAFLIELDNTQDNANHIHSVWRDLRNDFGADLLRAHYKTGHHQGSEG